MNYTRTTAVFMATMISASLLALPALAEKGQFGRSVAYDAGNPSSKATRTEMASKLSNVEPAAGPAAVSETDVSGTVAKPGKTKKAK